VVNSHKTAGLTRYEISIAYKKTRWLRVFGPFTGSYRNLPLFTENSCAIYCNSTANKIEDDLKEMRHLCPHLNGGNINEKNRNLQQHGRSREYHDLLLPEKRFGRDAQERIWDIVQFNYKKFLRRLFNAPLPTSTEKTSSIE
jgi:hypothetical protein